MKRFFLFLLIFSLVLGSVNAQEDISSGTDITPSNYINSLSLGEKISYYLSTIFVTQAAIDPD